MGLDVKLNFSLKMKEKDTSGAGSFAPGQGEIIGYARHIHGGFHSSQHISFEELSWIVRTCSTLSGYYMPSLMSRHKVAE
ncbi:hypothetical protein PanWU01x14_086320 [Parasponia andersonii]|uniref:Uncharacterized protein n=1 Tax=Parasponia andersonii TaxID=3476 RepID=A0A2P5D9A1_PARAD|nr:hypothetical protein PanWU01x14_086320 [Parasponia andersonii]